AWPVAAEEPLERRDVAGLRRPDPGALLAAAGPLCAASLDPRIIAVPGARRHGIYADAGLPPRRIMSQATRAQSAAPATSSSQAAVLEPPRSPALSAGAPTGVSPRVAVSIARNGPCRPVIVSVPPPGLSLRPRPATGRSPSRSMQCATPRTVSRAWTKGAPLEPPS